MTANQRGSLFMVAAMAGFAVEDMFIKSAAKAMPLGQVLALMGALGILWFALQSRRVGEPAFPAALRSRTMLVRSSFEMVGRLFYSLAIALTPISVASAILQATPLVVVAGAALIFGERVGLWRWALTALGFAGVLVILRPGLEGFDAMAILAVIGLLGFAGRDLATRAAPPALSNAQLGVAGFAVLGVSGVVILAVQGGAVLYMSLTSYFWTPWILSGSRPSSFIRCWRSAGASVLMRLSLSTLCLEPASNPSMVSWLMPKSLSSRACTWGSCNQVTSCP